MSTSATSGLVLHTTGAGQPPLSTSAASASSSSSSAGAGWAKGMFYLSICTRAKSLGVSRYVDADA